MSDKKYGWLIITEAGEIGLVEQDKEELVLSELQEAVDGHIEIVSIQGPAGFAVKLVVNDIGLYRDFSVNLVASILYGNKIVGPALLVTTIPEDRTKVPDIYAFTLEDAKIWQERLHNIAKMWL